MFVVRTDPVPFVWTGDPSVQVVGEDRGPWVPMARATLTGPVDVFWLKPYTSRELIEINAREAEVVEIHAQRIAELLDVSDLPVGKIADALIQSGRAVMDPEVELAGAIVKVECGFDGATAVDTITDRCTIVDVVKSGVPLVALFQLQTTILRLSRRDTGLLFFRGESPGARACPDPSE